MKITRMDFFGTGAFHDLSVARAYRFAWEQAVYFKAAHRFRSQMRQMMRSHALLAVEIAKDVKRRAAA